MTAMFSSATSAKFRCGKAPTASSSPNKPTEKPLLQGWAIVDNTVGEDWKDVQLTLVAGAPQSFIQQISQPLYMRRPTVALPTTAQLTPQTHEGTMTVAERDALLHTPSAGATQYEEMGAAARSTRPFD